MEKNRKKEKCCGCGACAEKCPEGAIQMLQDREGFDYPKIDKLACTDCGICVAVCPLKRNEKIKCQNFYFGAQAEKNQIRYSSSSGGIFSILAQYVIRRKGVVYGAGYDEHMNIRHRGVENQDQLEQIKKTKYVQSDMEGIYRSIEYDLIKNKWVLFCGTPCQTQALIFFLNKKYERLIAVDLVCYGVPSPGVWKRYVKYLEHKHMGKMADFSFRDKRNADNGSMISYKINGKEYVDSIHKDIYCRLYFRNCIMRPSCHQCKFCTVDRNSDFTIGDFWNIGNVRPDIDDGMGTSLVIVHSMQAMKIWDEIKEELHWFACEKEDVLQPRLLQPTMLSKRWQRYIILLSFKIVPFSMIVKLMRK